MKRYIITDSDGNDLYEAYFESEELAHKLAKDNGILDYQIFELKTQYELFMEFLESHNKTLDNIKHITIYSFWSNKYNISVDEYIKEIVKSYKNESWHKANIVLDDGLILVRSKYDYEYQRIDNEFEYISLKKEDKEWEERR